MRSRCQRTLVVEPLEQRQVLAVGALAITEIMYHPFDSDVERVAGLKDRDLEFIEIMNTGDTPVPLRGARLSDAIDFTFGQLTIEAGQHALVVHNRQAFETRYGTQLMIAGEYAGTLGNGGDHVVFQAASGNVLEDLTFEDTWYPATDGEGYSLTAVDPTNDRLDRNLSSSWQVSRDINGSPGFADGAMDPRPRNLVFSQQSSRHLQLRWDAPHHTSSDALDYRVYRDSQLIGSTAGTSFLDAGIAPDDRYEYQIAIVHSGGREFFGSPQIIETEAVGGDLAFANGVSQGRVRINGLTELSGMTGSRRNNNVFWTHNDGPQSSIYGISARGTHVATLRLGSIRALDWEDIAIGPGPAANVDYLYVGDLGGKDPKRNEVRVHRIPEPDVAESDSARVIDARGVDVITLRYPNGILFNAETLMSDPRTGDLYIIPKLGSGTPIYRADAARLDSGAIVPLELVAEIGFPNVSGGDISPDGSEIIIRSEDLAQLFPRADGQSVADAMTSDESQLIPVVGRPTEPNGEAITFDSDGRDYFTLSEGTDPVLYSFERIPTALAGDANRDQVFNSSDLVQVFQSGKYASGRPALFSQGDWNGDGRFDSGDLVAAFQTGLFEQPAAAPRFSNSSRDDGSDFRNTLVRPSEMADAFVADFDADRPSATQDDEATRRSLALSLSTSAIDTFFLKSTLISL